MALKISFYKKSLKIFLRPIYLAILILLPLQHIHAQDSTKVDLESLGLDNLSQAPLKEIKPVAQEADSIPKIELPGAGEKKKVAEVKKPEKDLTPDHGKGDIFQKMQRIMQGSKDLADAKAKELLKKKLKKKEVGTKEAKEEKAAKKDKAKKHDLKKRALKASQILKAEKIKIANEKKRQAKLDKLNKLRNTYLQNSQASMIRAEHLTDQDFHPEQEILIPRKKTINRFRTNNVPAIPILDRYRTKDNLHIPLAKTPQQKIDTMFKGITFGNIAFFNSAYRDVENPNVKNGKGDTALTYAILLQKYDVIASLISKGSDPNKPNDLGYNPLTIAIEMGDIKSFELLAKNKADIHYIDGFGRTYLMHAARVGFLPAVEFLVSKGAQINALDVDGFTALAIAYRHKKEVIVKYLKKHGAKSWIKKKYEPRKQYLIEELENRWK